MNLSGTLRGLVIGFVMMAGSAVAGEIGSHAFVRSAATTFGGPGAQYGAVSTLSQNDEVTVIRCSELWCQLAGSQAWVSIDALNFGQAHNGPHFGAFAIHGRLESGTVCVYDGANYTGDSLCLPSGRFVRDLAFSGWDNRISSVKVDEGTSVQLCRDINRMSHCELFEKDTPKLDWLINNAASSVLALPQTR